MRNDIDIYARTMIRNDQMYVPNRDGPYDKMNRNYRLNTTEVITDILPNSHGLPNYRFTQNQ
jgi:hypothetical protein